jgi:hypothetical protein
MKKPRKHNSEGIKKMFGGACAFDAPAIPPLGSCALCQEKLQVIGMTALCRECGALYIKAESKLWNYLGRLTRGGHKKTS